MNVLVLQFGVVKCCSRWSAFGCFENTLGILQIALQWLMFNLVLVLFIAYYPTHRKYVHLVAIPESATGAAGKRKESWMESLKHTFWPSLSDQTVATTTGNEYSDDEEEEDNVHQSVLLPSQIRTSQISWSPSYRLTLSIAFIVLLQFLFILFITFLLLLALPKLSSTPDEHDPPHPHHDEPHSIRVLRIWATFLGVTSMILATLQYFPQLYHTWSTRLVGSLSIPTMLIQARSSLPYFLWYDHTD